MTLFFYSAPASALAWHLDWSLLSHRVSGDQVSSTMFGLRSNIFAQQKISSTLSAKGRIAFHLSQGSHRALNENDEFAPRKEISLQQVLLQWTPHAQFRVQAGVLSSDRWNAPFLISPSQPVMGASQSFQKKFSNAASLHLRLQQSIPGEREKFYRVGQIDKGTPTLFLETLELQYKAVSLTVGHFAFNQLSHTSAYESQFMGNSVIPGTKETASFLYPYNGYLVNGAFQTPLFRNYDLHLKGHYVHNTRSPSVRNDGFLGHVGIQNPTVSVYGKYFINHSDSSPGIYNDKSYGHNNRKGYGLALSWKNPHKDHIVKFDFIRFNVLDRDIPQAIFQSDTNLAKISITFTPPQLSSENL